MGEIGAVFGEHDPKTLEQLRDVASRAERAALMADPGFGRVHTDHMVAVRWTPDRGWHDARLTAYAPLTLDPATSALHYGQAIFEGLKAYRQPDGGVAVFRPEENARRFNRTRCPARWPGAEPP